MAKPHKKGPLNEREKKAWLHVVNDQANKLDDEAFYAIVMPRLWENRKDYEGDVEMEALFAAFDASRNVMDWDAYREFWLDQYSREDEEHGEPWKTE